MSQSGNNHDANLYFHISARCLNKEWFAIPLEEVWQIMSDQLFFLSHAFGARIYAFVLMSNHFHLLAAFPNSNRGEALRYFMKETSVRISRRAGRINQTYGARYFRSLISSNHYFQHAYKYTYRNPVDAGICRQVEVYPYSTLSGILGLQHLMIPLVEDAILFEDVEGTLQWLNKAPNEDDRASVRKALRRKQFALPINYRTKKPSHLESQRF